MVTINHMERTAMTVIRLTPNLYSRLASHAEGFDTPAQVISRLLDAYEGVSPSSEPGSMTETSGDKPTLSFHPDEASFKKHLVGGNNGQVIIHYKDGTTSEKVWNATRFSSSSNLRGNIWSGFLRGWHEKGITHADFHPA